MGSLGAEVVARKPMWVYPKMVGFNPSERWGHSACYSNGLVYVFGGCCGGLHFSDVLVLNLETMGWSALVTKGCGPGPRDSHTAVMWGNTKMVVFGGTNGFKKVNDLHILDLGSNEWTRAVYKGDPPSPRESHTSTLVGDDKLVVFGGNGEGVGNYLNDLHMLDLKTMTWSSPVVKGDHIPAPRDSHVCVGVGNALFLFGGDSGDRYHGGVERLDLHTMSWSKLAIEGCAPGARAGHAAVGIGSKIFVIGGVGDKKYYNDAWSLDTETSSWYKLDVFSGSKAVPQGRFSHTAVVANSDIAIYGGCGEDERPLRELLILQLGAADTYVYVDGEGNNYNNLVSSPCKSLERDQHQLSQHRRQVGRRRIHLGEEKSLHKPKTMILGIEIEAADQKRENKMNDHQPVHRKRKRTTINNNNSNNNSNSNYTTSWEVSEPEEHSHSLSLSSQHSSPSQSDQEQQPSTTSTKKTKSSPPTSHQSAAVAPSPPLLLPFLNHQSNSNQHHHPSRRNAVLPNNNTTVASIHSTSVRPLPQLQQSPPCHHEVSLPVATEERRLQSLIGAEVQGKVDGAFDSGYLMTAVVNGRIFRGVLFSPVPNVVYRRGDQSLSSYNGGGSRQHHHVPAAVSHQPPPHNTTYAAERGPGLLNKPINSMQPKLVGDSNGFGRTRMSSSILQPTTSSFLVGEKDKETVPSSAKSNDLQGVVLTLGGPGAGSG